MEVKYVHTSTVFWLLTIEQSVYSYSHSYYCAKVLHMHDVYIRHVEVSCLKNSYNNLAYYKRWFKQRKLDSQGKLNSSTLTHFMFMTIYGEWTIV